MNDDVVVLTSYSNEMRAKTFCGTLQNEYGVAATTCSSYSTREHLEKELMGASTLMVIADDNGRYSDICNQLIVFFKMKKADGKVIAVEDFQGRERDCYSPCLLQEMVDHNVRLGSDRDILKAVPTVLRFLFHAS